MVRLQKYLAECGVASRRAAEELIKDAKIRVNGKLITTLGFQIDPIKDRIQVGSRFVRPLEKGILLFYKPRDVVSTLFDPEGRRCISDYLSKHYRSYFPIGRLDWESTGLIVLTNDGELAERLLHPRYGFERKYQVRVAGQPSDKSLERLENGLRLKDGIARAKVRFLNSDEKSTWLELSVVEGRNRIVRRMMEQIRHPVLKLNRISHGPFKLRKLKPGQMRKLTKKEYDAVREKVLSKER